MTKNSVAPGVHSAEAGEPCLNPSHHCIVHEELPLFSLGRVPPLPLPVRFPSSRTQFTSHPFHEPPATLSFPLTYPFLSVPAASDLFLRLSSLSLVLALAVYMVLPSTAKVPLRYKLLGSFVRLSPYFCT